jgi:hypothetical protein
MRPQLIALTMLPLACRSPEDRVRDEVASLCGAQFDAGRGGCDSMVDKGGWFARATRRHDDDGRIESIEVRVAGHERELEALRGRALAVVEPVLDRTQRDFVARALARVFRAGIGGAPRGPGMSVVGNAVVIGATEVDLERPWERMVELRILFNHDAAPESPHDELPAVPPEEFASTMAALDDHVIARWEALCRDGAELERLLGFAVADPPRDDERAGSYVPTHRWNRGETWLRCRVGDADRQRHGWLLVDAVWAPLDRRLLFARVAAHGQPRAEGLRDVVERLVIPLLTPDQADTMRTAADAELTGGHATVDGARISSSHTGSTHEVAITDS